MVALIKTVTLEGVDAHIVDVQVQVSPGLSSFHIVGLPDGAVRESRERVRGAFHSIGISFPAKRITVNLSPADILKEGNHFDLPIAIGLLCALGLLPLDIAENSVFMGELGLDASIRDIRGALPAAIAAMSYGFSNLYLPKNSAKEAVWAEKINIYGTQTLKDIITHFKSDTLLEREKIPELTPEKEILHTIDFQDVRGQESVKRAAEIAAAGGHNMLMCGPPGSGKSMIAKRISTILPSLSAKEALEVSMVHSVAGVIGQKGLITNRPFRDPHHSASAVALCGGGNKAKPGEMSLAHNGVLFLDELPEFPRNVLETLRQPLETNQITISRANHHITYPARFQFIAAMNPSPCGYLGHPTIPCKSTPKQIANYLSRLSGPLMDRIDIHVQVPVVNLKDLSLPPAKESSEKIKFRVIAARKVQQERFMAIGKDDGFLNAHMEVKELDKFCKLTAEGENLLLKASEKYNLSARAYHRLLKVSRTIADLSSSIDITKTHVAEALMYRDIPEITND